MKVRAYEGKEKFIFVSYAHKDSEQVLGIIRKMQEQGYRIWFDEGIAPGSEWPEDIANHLKDSAMVLAFISVNSVASVNCRNEINFAFSKNKPFLGIVMEQVEMSPGMEMQLASKQCIFRYNYDSEQEFLNKVMKCPDLAPCKGQELMHAKPETVKAAEQPKRAEEAQAISVPKQAAIAKQAEVPVSPSTQKTQRQAVPVKENAPSKSNGREKQSFWKSKTFIIAVSACVAVIGLIIGLVCYNRVKITGDITVRRGETYLTLTGENITAEQIEQLNKLKKLRLLIFDGCTFEENVFDGWEPHEEITSFTVKNTDTLKDYSFLQKQPGIQYLYLISCGLTDENFSAVGMNKLIRATLENNPEFTDLSLISKESLTGLDISGTGVEDLSPMSDSKLKTLDFSHTKVSDVTPMGMVLSLITVDGSNTDVSDITPLAVLQNLTELYFNDCKIQSITENMMSLKMQKIGFANNGLQECSGFEYFTVLAEVDLSGNHLRNVDFLKKSVAALKVLDISGNDLDETEVDFLSLCTGMEKLYLDDLLLANLDFVSTMINLNTIYANHCGLLDISGLSGSSNLQVVRLAYNDIADLTGLQNLTFKYSTVLDLAYNQVTDITTLARGHYSWLILLGNDINYTNGAFVEITGSDLVFNYKEDMMDGELANDIFYNYYLVDCPADRQLEVQNVLGKAGTYFMSEEDVLEYLLGKGIDYSRWQN